MTNEEKILLGKDTLNTFFKSFGEKDIYADITLEVLFDILINNRITIGENNDLFLSGSPGQNGG